MRIRNQIKVYTDDEANVAAVWHNEVLRLGAVV